MPDATSAPGIGPEAGTLTTEAPITAPAESAPAAAHGGTNRWLILVIACLAQFMVVLDATVVNVALPSIQKGLHFSPASLQWVVNAYTLIFGGFLLLGGRAADLLGRKRLFVAGVVLFSAASLLNGLAQSSGMLIVGRGLQGLGGALLSPAALSIVIATFTEQSERTKALGVWSAIAAGGGAVGLIMGGALTQLASWEWIFFVNVPVGIVTLLATLRFVPESRATVEHRTFDLAGAITVTGGLVVLVYAIVKAQSFGWGSARTVGLIAAALALLAAFVAIERRSKAPLVRLSIFRVRTLTVANIVLLLVASGLFGMFFFASLYVQEILGYSPLKAGLAFLPVTGGIVVGAGIAQQLIKRIGIRNNALIGIVLATIGMVVLAGVPVHGSYAARPVAGPAADEHRDGPDIRADHADGHRRRGRERRRARLRAVQHLPAGGRLARAGHPVHARREPDEQPAERPARRGPIRRQHGRQGLGLPRGIHRGCRDARRWRRDPRGGGPPARRRGINVEEMAPSAVAA